MASQRTATGTYIGTCTGGCGKVKTSEKFVRHTCGEWIVGYTEIKAKVTEHVCGPKCTSALGPNCDCVCGGRNHGADHH